MSNLYLVRHGQAGTRDAYDALSDLGRRQSRALGEYLVSQEIEFNGLYSGTLQRQQQTAAEVVAAYREAKRSIPEAIIDARWNEFDLTNVYREIAPQFCEADAQFRSEYEEMQRQLRQSAGLHEADIHRRWWPCDSKIVEAWISGRFSYGGESWQQFCERVTQCLSALSNGSRPANTLVFTSAAPIGISTARALNATDGRVRQLAGVLFNASYTLLRQREDQLYLFQFNAVPHLASPGLRTHR